MQIGRGLLAAIFLISGFSHFAFTQRYLAIMPPYLPEPKLLVQISGLAELLGGTGLLIPATRSAAAWGLVALLIAVFPANLSMAINHAHWPGIPAWILWLRLPLQLPLIWWAWIYTRR